MRDMNGGEEGIVKRGQFTWRGKVRTAYQIVPVRQKAEEEEYNQR